MLQLDWGRRRCPCSALRVGGKSSIWKLWQWGWHWLRPMLLAVCDAGRAATRQHAHAAPENPTT